MLSNQDSTLRVNIAPSEDLKVSEAILLGDPIYNTLQLTLYHFLPHILLIYLKIIANFLQDAHYRLPQQIRPPQPPTPWLLQRPTHPDNRRLIWSRPFQRSTLRESRRIVRHNNSTYNYQRRRSKSSNRKRDEYYRQRCSESHGVGHV